MNKRGTGNNPKMLLKLFVLYGSRVQKARSEYKSKLPDVDAAKKAFNLRNSNFDAVSAEEKRLLHCLNSATLANSISGQKLIRTKKYWLKYDYEKTQYFLNEAKHALASEREVLRKRRACWMNLKEKQGFYEKSLKRSRIARTNKIEEKEEQEQFEETCCQNRKFGEVI